MNTCETCRFWLRDGEARELYSNLGGYVVTPHRKCVGVIFWYDENAMKPSTPAAVLDGSGYAACLYTLPSFGCALHEPRPPDEVATANVKR